VLNAVIRPYLVGRADFLASRLARWIPEPVQVALGSYNRWLAAARHQRRTSAGSRFALNLLFQLAVNATLVAACFLAAGYVESRFPPPAWLGVADGTLGEGVLYWFAAMLACMPLLVASHRKVEALGMILADMAIPSTMPRAAQLRPILARMLHVAGSAAMGGILVVSSTTLLPGWPTLLLLLGSAAILGILFGRSFNAWYSRAKFALVETWQNPPAPAAEIPALPPMLKEADLSLHAIGPHLAGLLIRELNLRARTGVSIVAIERAGHSIVNPGPDELLQAGDQLLLLGAPGQLPKAIELLQRTPAA
jgi:CPA2 family monovalent cation:H+ antiporter-2